MNVRYPQVTINVEENMPGHKLAKRCMLALQALGADEGEISLFAALSNQPFIVVHAEAKKYFKLEESE